MYISFKVYILVYSACVFVLSIILLQLRSKISGLRSAGKLSVRGVRSSWIVMAMVVAAILPHMLRVALYGIYADPDVRAYEADSLSIIESGYINPDKLQEDVYYRSFPIFTLLNVILTLSSSTPFYWTYVTLHLTCLLLFTLFIFMILKMTSTILSSFNSLNALVAILLLYSSIYFYALWDCLTPIKLGMATLLMLLFVFIKTISSRRVSYVVNLLLLYFFSLVHITIPIYLLILTSSAIIEKDKELSKHILKSLIPPVIVFTFYTSFSYLVLESFIHRLDIFRVYYEVVQKSGYTLSKSELHHPIPALNAFGPAISVGVTAAFFLTVLLQIIKGKHSPDFNIKLLFGMSSVSLVLLLIGGFYYIFSGATGLGNVMMYPLMYGSFLSYIVSLYVLWQVPWQTLENPQFPLRIRFFFYFYIVLLIIGAIGGISDPFTFLEFRST